MGTSAEKTNEAESASVASARRLLNGNGPIQRILLCVDRSPLAEAGIPHAVMLARAFDVPITILHVVPSHAVANGSRAAVDVLGWELSKKEAYTYLERLEREVSVASGHEVDVLVEQGHPAERIGALGRELGASLTILGSHGEGGLAAWNLGSTVQQVLLVTKGSVLVARPGGASDDAYPKRILVPLDGSLRTESVLPVAARLAGSEGAEIILAHVVVEPSPNGVLSAKSDVELAKELTNRLESGAARYLEHLRAHVLRDVRAVKTLVARSPDEGRCLLDLVERQAVDFVVLSAHGASCDPARTFGSVTAQLLWHSRVPLLVLQDLHDSAADAVVESEGRGAPPLRAQFAEEAT